MTLLLPGGRNAADSKIFSGSFRESHEHGFRNPNGSFDAANSQLQRQIGACLSKHYPGHPWGVMAEIEHGIVKIALQGFTQWPFVIHCSTLKADPGLQSVIRAGGEILERLRMPRKGFSLADFKAATTRNPWHFYRNRKPPE